MSKIFVAIIFAIFIFPIISVANAETIDDYTEIIKNNPNDFMAYQSRGIAYAKQKNFQQAVLDFSEAIKLNPTESRLYYNRALAYYYLKNYSQAISDCNQAIKLNPNYGATYTNRGNCYFKLQNFQSAISDYIKALELNPNDVNANKNLKIAKQKFNQYAEVYEQNIPTGYIISKIKTSLNNSLKSKQIKKLKEKFKIEQDKIGTKIEYSPKKIYAAPICLFPWIKVDLEKNTVSLYLNAEYYSEYHFNSSRLFSYDSGSADPFYFNKVLVRTDNGLHKIRYEVNHLKIKTGTSYSRFLSSSGTVHWIHEYYMEMMNENTFNTFASIINSKNKVYIKFEDNTGEFVEKELKPKHLQAFKDTLELFEILRS